MVCKVSGDRNHLTEAAVRNGRGPPESERPIYGIGDAREEAVANARREVEEPEAEFDATKGTDEFAKQIEQNDWDGSRQTFAINANGFSMRRHTDAIRDRRVQRTDAKDEVRYPLCRPAAGDRPTLRA